MAKRFAPHEKSTIVKSLHLAGLKRFSRKGVRAVRIDDLCHDVGISKGSFYSFFPSKEALFMAIANQRDAAHKSDMRKFFNTFLGKSDAFASAFFDMIVEKIDTDPMMQLMIEHGEAQYLLRKISPEMMLENAKVDRDFVEEMAISLRKKNPDCTIQPDQIEGLMTLTVALIMQRIMPQSQFENAKKLLRQVYITQLSS